MPFRSSSQRKLFHAMADRGEISKKTVKHWEDATPKGKKLPEHVKKAVAYALAKHAEPPPPEGVSVQDWDRILQQGPKKTLHSIPGGEAENQPIGKYDRVQLSRGMKVEREHTPNPLMAEEIATDHLEEFPMYYTALDKMEEKLKKGKTAAYRLGVFRAIEKLGSIGSAIPLSLLAAGGGAVAAPSGQRANTAIHTGLGAWGVGTLGDVLGEIADELLKKKLKLPPHLLQHVARIGGTGLGAIMGHEAAKKHTWGALPRFRYEHGL